MSRESRRRRHFRRALSRIGAAALAAGAGLQAFAAALPPVSAAVRAYAARLPLARDPDAAEGTCRE